MPVSSGSFQQSLNSTRAVTGHTAAINSTTITGIMSANTTSTRTSQTSTKPPATVDGDTPPPPRPTTGTSSSRQQATSPSPTTFPEKPNAPSSTTKSTTPKPTSPKPPSTEPPSINPIHLGTTTLITTKPGQKSTATSTITMSPDSTLGRPVAILTTDPANGSTSSVIPPIVTILSTSTEPDGSFLTFTHVVANPTGFQAGAHAVTPGFLQNQGAVAGVFTVVGMVASATIVGAFFIIRRHRRKARRDRWLADMRQPFRDIDNSFHEPHSPSTGAAMTQRGSPVGRRQSVSSFYGGALPVVPPSRLLPDSASPFADIHGYQENTGQDYSGQAIFRTAPSIAQSSPSVYAATIPLPPEDDADAQRPYQDVISVPEHTRRDVVNDAPPRPPRSQLRDTILRANSGASATTSSHSHTRRDSNPQERTPGVPDSESYWNIQGAGGKSSEGILARRTLLDVRPRY